MPDKASQELMLDEFREALVNELTGKRHSMTRGRWLCTHNFFTYFDLQSTFISL